MSNECTICLVQYTEETKKTTECNHTFHDECIGRWLQTNNSCPLCRTVLNQQKQTGLDETDTETLPRLIYSPPPINYSNAFQGSSRYGGLMQLVAYGAQDRMLTSIYTSSTVPPTVEDTNESPTINYRGSSIMQLIAFGAQDITLTAPTTPKPKPKRTQIHSDTQQSIRSQIKHNNSRQSIKHQNKRR